MRLAGTTNSIIGQLTKNCPAYIQKQFQLKNYKAGSLICRQGEAPTSVGIILDGYAKSYYSVSADKNYLVEVLKSGSIIFDIEILDELPCVCSVESITECTVITVSKSTYIAWLEHDFGFSMYINKSLCTKVYKHITKSATIMYTVKRRFLEWMLSSLKTHEHYSYKIKLSKEIVAEELGTTTRSINRIIKELSEKNIVVFENNILYIKSFELINQELLDMFLK